MSTGETYTLVDTFMQEPNLALLHSFEDDDVLTAFKFNIAKNGLYSEPEYSSDASQEQPYEPNLQEWETNTMVYLATTKHTDIRQAIRPQLNMAAKCLNQVNEHHATNRLNTLRIHSASYLRNANDKANTSPLPPWTEWKGIPIRDAVPITPDYTARFDPKVLQNGLHVWEPFGGMSCSGAIMTVEQGKKIGTYTNTDIDGDARDITRAFLPKIQTRYPGLLPTSAIKGFDTRLNHDISKISDDNLDKLIAQRGPIDFIFAGWECHMISKAGQGKEY